MDQKQAPPAYSANTANTSSSAPHNAGGGYAPGPAYGQPYPYAQPYGGGYSQQSSSNNVVVVGQPTAGPGMVINTVPDNMGLAIFTTICCCWPLGLVAIMRAQESRRALDRGDIGSASTFSAESRRYSMWAIAGGCISVVIAIIIIVVVVTQNANRTHYYYG